MDDDAKKHWSEFKLEASIILLPANAPKPPVDRELQFRTNTPIVGETVRIHDMEFPCEMIRSLSPVLAETMKNAAFVRSMTKEDPTALEFFHCLCMRSWYTKPLADKEYAVLLRFATKYQIELMINDCRRLYKSSKRDLDNLAKRYVDRAKMLGMSKEEMVDDLFGKE